MNRKAQEHVQQNWVPIGSRERTMYVPRAELEEDEAMDFDSLLQSMKMEQLGM